MNNERREGYAEKRGIKEWREKRGWSKEREESCSTRSEGRMIGRRVEEKSLVLQIAVTPTD